MAAVKAAEKPARSEIRGPRVRGLSRGKRVLLAVAALLLVTIAAFAWSFRSAPLPAPQAYDGSWPEASPPTGMTLHALPTGITHRTAAFAYRGGSFSDERKFAMTAVLVRHPRGDLLIDTGFGRDIDAHFAMMPAYFRAGTRYDRMTSARDQLDAAGYDVTRLRGILLTHAHWDHVSGVPDFPGVPVLVPRAERAFIEDGGSLTRVAKSFGSIQYEEYSFDGGDYLGFSSSHDLHGDGSVVVVPAPGHTPGSVIVFVTPPGPRRYAFLGDLVWQREGITLREERPWLQRTLGDDDVDLVRDNIRHVSALASRFENMVLVPAHDARAFAELPPL